MGKVIGVDKDRILIEFWDEASNSNGVTEQIIELLSECMKEEAISGFLVKRVGEEFGKDDE